MSKLTDRSVITGGQIDSALLIHVADTAPSNASYKVALGSLGSVFVLAGGGTADYLSRWTDTDTLGVGITRDDGTTVGFGVAPAAGAKVSITSDVAKGLELNSNAQTWGFFENGTFKNTDTQNSLASRLMIGNSDDYTGTDTMLAVEGTAQVGYDPGDISKLVASAGTRFPASWFGSRKATLIADDYNYITIHAGKDDSSVNAVGVVGVKLATGASNHETDMFFGTRGAGATASSKIIEGLRISYDQKVTISNAYTLPSTDGTALYFLQTDGAGNVSWAAGGGGAVGVNDLTEGYYDIASDNNIAIGKENWETGLLAGATGNTIYGIECGDAITSADNCTLMGYFAGDAITTGKNNTCLGGSAGSTSAAMENSTFIGYNCGGVFSNAALQNTMTGVLAFSGGGANRSNYNSGYGYNSLNDINTVGAGYNSAFGYYSGAAITSGRNNVCFGDFAGDNVSSSSLTTGRRNIFIGTSVVFPTGSGTRNDYMNIGDVLFGDIHSHATPAVGINRNDTFEATLHIQGNTTASTSSGLLVDDSGGSKNFEVTDEGVCEFRSFVVAGLPVATTAGGLIYVSDETGGGVMAFSDGTNWRRVTDRAIVA